MLMVGIHNRGGHASENIKRLFHFIVLSKMIVFMVLKYYRCVADGLGA